MAYGNMYPVGYNYYSQQQPQMQMQPQIQPQPQQQNSNIIWVSGEAGAKAYLVAPNSTVQLWDSENRTIYLKSADASGMPSMKILDYTIRGEAAPTVMAKDSNNLDFATHEELKDLENRLIEKIKEVTNA